MSYSPFFTSGLLSSRPLLSYASSIQGPRRGSLPVDVESLAAPSSSSDPHTFYFTLQPRRDEKELRSFLSLDLAESVISRSTSRVESSVFPKRQRLSSHIFLESIRSIPSPKPAPSSALPTLPSPSKRALCSAPAPARRRRAASTLYLRTTSASSNFRAGGRTDALACLEGRSSKTERIPRKAIQRNFIHLTDDDEEVSTLASSVVEEEEDIVLPSPAFLAPATAARKPTASRIRNSWFPLASFVVAEHRANFLDVSSVTTSDESSTWNWRSFIEVASII